MSDLDPYISTLPAEDRALAREYGEMPAPEFQARMGPAVDKIIDRLDALSPNGKRGLSRIAAINLGDVAKTIGGGIIGALVLFIRHAS